MRARGQGLRRRAPPRSRPQRRRGCARPRPDPGGSPPRMPGAGKGSAAEPASAPNSTALNTLPVASASAAMSNARSSRAASRQADSSAARVRAAVGERDLLGHGEDAMGRGDEQRPVRRDEAALHRARGLHQLGGEHDIDVARHRHQREHRLAAGRLRRRFGEQFDVVDRRAGALGDAGNGGRLREIAAVLGKIDDPVRQHAAALAAQRNHGDGDRPRRQRSGVHLARHAAARRASMRRCRAPITALRSFVLEPVPRRGIGDDRGAVERGAKHGRVRHLPAQSAADAGIDHLGHRLAAQRVGIGRERERGASRQPNAGMIAGAGIGIDAEALAHHALAALQALAHQRPHAPLLVEHAFRLGDDDLRPLDRGSERLLERVAHPADVIGARDRAHPVDADAAHRLLDRVLGRAHGIVGGGGGHVLPAGRRRVAVVDHDQHVVALVEDGVADARGEPVVPEAAVADERDGALAGRGIERAGAGAAQPVAHGGIAEVERRQDREQMAADVAAHVMRPELALDELHGGEDRPLRTAGAKRGRAAVHLSRDALLRLGHAVIRSAARRRRERSPSRSGR